MATYKYYKDMLKRKYFEIFFPSQSMDKKMNDAIIIVGKKGSGKTSLAMFLIKLFHKFKPKNNIFVFTQVPENFSGLKKIINLVDLNSMIADYDENSGLKYSDMFPELPELNNSLVILDDVENIPIKRLNSMMNRFISILFQNGRNYNVQIVLILHHLNKGSISTPILKETDSIVIFPDSFDFNLLNTLIKHYGFARNKALELFRKKEKFLLLRNTNPMYLFGATSRKKFSVNKI